MTEVAKRRRRLSKGALRAIAWIAGGAAFAAPFASLTVSPKPASAQAAGAAKGRRVIVVREITRRVVVHPAPDTPAVQYVYVGSGPSSSSSSSNASTSPANNGSSNTSTAAAPPPPPASSTGGS